MVRNSERSSFFFLKLGFFIEIKVFSLSTKVEFLRLSLESYHICRVVFFGFFRRFRVHCKYSWPYLYGSENLQEPAQLSLGLSWRPCGRGPKHSANPRKSAAAPQSSLGDRIWTAAFSGPSHGAGFGRRTFDRQVRRRRRQP